MVDDIASYFESKEKAKDLRYNRKYINNLIKEMQKYSKENKFEEAIVIRDHLLELGIDIQTIKNEIK